MLRQTALALPLTLYLGVPTSIYDTFWFGAAGNGDAARENFLLIYGLEIVTILIESEETEVVRPKSGYLDYWISWGLYVLTPESTCSAGCQQSTFP